MWRRVWLEEWCGGRKADRRASTAFDGLAVHAVRPSCGGYLCFVTTAPTRGVHASRGGVARSFVELDRRVGLRPLINAGRHLRGLVDRGTVSGSFCPR